MEQLAASSQGSDSPLGKAEDDNPEQAGIAQPGTLKSQPALNTNNPMVSKASRLSCHWEFVIEIYEDIAGSLDNVAIIDINGSIQLPLNNEDPPAALGLLPACGT